MILLGFSWLIRSENSRFSTWEENKLYLSKLNIRWQRGWLQWWNDTKSIIKLLLLFLLSKAQYVENKLCNIMCNRNDIFFIAYLNGQWRFTVVWYLYIVYFYESSLDLFYTIFFFQLHILWKRSTCYFVILDVEVFIQLSLHLGNTYC